MDNKKLFVSVYNNINRDGADRLLAHLENGGFFDDPASARNHMNKPGGLCEHSLNVYRRLRWLCEAEGMKNKDFAVPSVETIAIAGLLHDVCKMGTYKLEPRNQKSYDLEKVKKANKYQIKHDAMGDFIWETVEIYTNDDPFPFGHGEKSVYIIQSFMPLMPDEAFAIRYHMSSWQDGEKSGASAAFKMFELAMLLHMADEFATFVDEKE